MSGAFAIAPATLADVPALLAQWRALMAEQQKAARGWVLAEDAELRWRNDLHTWIASPVHRVFVAREVPSGVVIGFVTALPYRPPPLYRDELEVLVQEVFVRPATRRDGVAQALLHEVKVWAHSLGACRMRAEVAYGNDLAQNFWQRSGFDEAQVTFVLEVKK